MTPEQRNRLEVFVRLFAGNEHAGLGPLEQAHAIRAALAQVDALTAERDRLREALRKIADPIADMTERAKREGAVLNSYMAVALGNDPHHLKSMARAALAPETPEGSTE